MRAYALNINHAYWYTRPLAGAGKKNMKKDGKNKLIPLAILLLMSVGVVTAATLWVISLTANTSLVASPYFFKAFSDDACTLPITSIDFGAIQMVYSGNSMGAWKSVTLQIQAAVPTLTCYYIKPALTGTLPNGASIECKIQAYDLTWSTSLLTDSGTFRNAATQPYCSPLINGLQVQRFQYRIVFLNGSNPVSGSFGIQYTVTDVA